MITFHAKLLYLKYF